MVTLYSSAITSWSYIARNTGNSRQLAHTFVLKCMQYIYPWRGLRGYPLPKNKKSPSCSHGMSTRGQAARRRGCCVGCGAAWSAGLATAMMLSPRAATTCGRDSSTSYWQIKIVQIYVNIYKLTNTQISKPSNHFKSTHGMGGKRTGTRSLLHWRRL